MFSVCSIVIHTILISPYQDFLTVSHFVPLETDNKLENHLHSIKLCTKLPCGISVVKFYIHGQPLAPFDIS